MLYPHPPQKYRPNKPKSTNHNLSRIPCDCFHSIKYWRIMEICSSADSSPPVMTSSKGTWPWPMILPTYPLLRARRVPDAQEFLPQTRRSCPTSYSVIVSSFISRILLVRALVAIHYLNVSGFRHHRTFTNNIFV